MTVPAGTAPDSLSEHDLKQYVADELERGRDRSVGADRPGAGRVRAARPALPADVAAGVGPRAHRQLRGAVAAARGRPASSRCGPSIDDIYDAFEHPRADPADAAAAQTGRGRALHRPGPAQGARLPRHDAGSTATGRCSTRASCSAWSLQHEHQHDETMLATHQLRRGDPVLAGDRRPPAPAGADPLPAEVLVPGGPFLMGTSTDPWAYDNERPAHEVDVRAVLHRHGAGDQRRLRRVRRGRRLRRRPRWWTAAGWAVALRVRASASPAFWLREGGQLDAPPVRPRRAAARRRARAARLLVRGRRLRPLGGPAAAHRGRVGEGRVVGPATGTQAPLPVGRRRRRADEHANLGQRRCRPAPVGLLPGGRVSRTACQQMVGDVWEWTLVGLHGYPGFRSFPYKEYSEVFFGAGLQGAARRVAGRPTRSPAARTFRNWDYPIRRQIFAGFRTRPGRLMCRHLAYLGAPRSLQALLYRPAALAVRAVLGAAPAAARHRQRRRLRRRLVRRPAAPRPVRYRRAQPIWTDASFACLAPTWSRPARSLARCARRPSASPPTRRPRRAVHRTGRWLFSHNGRLARLADGAAQGADRRSPPTCPTPRRRRATRRCCSALALARLAGRGVAAATALAGAVRDVLAPGGAAGSTCWPPTASRLAATTCGDTLFVRGEPTGAVVASEPYDDEPGWREVADRDRRSELDARCARDRTTSDSRRPRVTTIDRAPHARRPRPPRCAPTSGPG